MVERGEHCPKEDLGEITILVKTRGTCARTKRPRGALLQLGVDLNDFLRSVAGTVRTPIVPLSGTKGVTLKL